MLRTLPAAAAGSTELDNATPDSPPPPALPPLGPALRRSSGPHEQDALPGAADRPLVEITSSGAVKRRTICGPGITAELVQLAGRDRAECRYRAASDLLVACERGARRKGETAVDGARRSSLRDLARKLTFVPAGHEYVEWHEPRTPMRLMFFYLDADRHAAGAQPRSAPAAADRSPRVLFEDEVLWGTIIKLKGLIEGGLADGAAYLEALGAVLAYELRRPQRSAGGDGAPAKGGLAGWQQRAVTAYIEEHLAEQIPLATLARLARLSPYHFARAFKHSFGVPPHRYHTRCRIERAKALLANRALSVTDIGLALGFSETSSFTAAFRKTTGLTPSRYYRSIG